MQRKLVVIVFLLGCVIVAVGLSSFLIERGGTPIAVIFAASLFLVFLVIPVIGAVRSTTQLDSKQPKLFSLWLPKERTKAKMLTLFVLCPLLVGLIVLVTYPISPYLTGALSLVVIFGASIFYALID